MVKLKRLPPKNRITYPIESYDIIVPFPGVELDSEATRVTCQIGKLASEGDSRETHEDWSFNALAAKEVGLLIVSTCIIVTGMTIDILPWLD
jgi:hypothetical protein